jgi:hypothetical protein
MSFFIFILKTPPPKKKKKKKKKKHRTETTYHIKIGNNDCRNGCGAQMQPRAIGYSVLEEGREVDALAC